MLEPRQRRIADNESRFRDINERLEADLRRLPDGGEPIEFVCECGRVECAGTVRLTLGEYERVRSEGALFALIPGHEIADVEDVVAQTDRYIVVRKKPPSQPYVEARDPRSDA